MERRHGRRCAAALAACTLILGACAEESADTTVDNDSETETEAPLDETSDDEEFADDEFTDEEAFDETSEVEDEEFADEEALDDSGFDDGTVEDESSDGAAQPGGGSRDDIDCEEVSQDGEEIYTFTTIHYVVDGELGDVCLGDPDERLLDAWNVLATISPDGQLADLGVFAAFESAEDGDDVTLAFVNTLDDDGTQFQMSVNLDSYEADLNEAQLTMAHEFSHVFTALTTQTDRTIEAIDGCTTYSPGDGCYYEDSLMYAWIQEFWGDGLIDEIDPNEEITADTGRFRCDADAGFFGPYAGGAPEEDFAEAFSAYVFDLETYSDGQQARLDWMDAQPGLAEFRDRAEAAGLTPLDNNFDECGLG